MAADLHIHILDNLHEDVVKRSQSRSLGSKWLNWCPGEESSAHFNSDYEAIARTPNIWIGEVSWLKAALFQDETYVPETVEAVSELVGEDFPVISNKMIAAVKEAFRLPNRSIKENGVYGGKGYSLAEVSEVVAFLENHNGKRVFTVSW